MRQMTLATNGFEKHRKQTRKAEFLSRMDKLVPWAELYAVIEPFYPKAGNGRPPIGLERILRMYFIAHWFNLADEACEDALYDIAAFRDFCRIDLGREGVPDATSLLGFRHLLEEHKLGAAMFARVGELLQANGLRLSGGTIVDATIIAAPSSTKNADKARDPEMHQTKKGNQWHFGMKVHIGADSKSGLVHSASVTPANVHDSQELPRLLHGNETRLYGDSAYTGQRDVLKQISPKAKDFTNKRARRNQPSSDAGKDTNRRKSQVRAKVEHPFRPFKSIFGFAKARYRGLMKNANRAFALLALINIEKWGRPLTGVVRPA
ncbi:MAG: IS5 family transposase [Gallionellaceae bacterium]